ncbi:LYR motif-containing protein 2 isoform X1 [Calonectris borealis]|uniref:LYR motif-containing protein 2 isoform X1 n=1 Tax=Calonectris borealis TaxID=1323832 RepID=UPI003F4B9553
MAAGGPRPPGEGSAAAPATREAELRVMAASRLPPSALTLKQFLRRQQVLQLYRKILRAIREVPAEADRRYLKDWTREEFRRNKDATEEVRIGNSPACPPALGSDQCAVLGFATCVCFEAIRMMITQGNMQLQELQRTLKLAKS